MKKMFKAYFKYPPFIVYLCCFFFLCFWIVHTGLIKSYWPWLFVAPVLQGPFEWTMHRYLLHAEVDPKHHWAYRYMKRLHYDHHGEPSKPELIFAQPSASLAIFVGFYPLFALILGAQAALVPLTSVFLGYLFYEWTHLGHHTQGYEHLTAHGKKMKEFHLCHHYKNENYWWGITLSWFDALTGTMPTPKTVTRSEGVKKVGQASGEV